MRYDANGFPIPPEFEPVPLGQQISGSVLRPVLSAPPPLPPIRSGSRKRWLLVMLVAAGLVPAIIVPELMPLIRQAVVEWSLERAALCEARNDLEGASENLGRALHWHGDDVDLLCMRAMLRLESRDAAGALIDANQAVAIAPTAIAPLRTRALVQVVLKNPEAALADAKMVVELAARGDPEALNHRSYIRALVGRDLPAAIDDINAAIASDGEASAELLDTRGFLLHLSGKHREAIDQLNLAIDSMQQFRRQLSLLAGRIDPSELARRNRSLEHGLAVMFQHRGLACQAIGLEAQAQQDFEQATRKGFDPSRGIF